MKTFTLEDNEAEFVVQVLIMLKTVSSITNAIGALNYKGTWKSFGAIL